MIKIIAGLFLIILFYGCVKSDKDTQAPAIEILEWYPTLRIGEVCGGYQEEILELNDNDSIVLMLKISDDQGLSEMKFDIHQNFDCHGHRTATKDWLFQEIKPLHGTLFQDRVVLYPPVNSTSGDYHFGIQATDLSGNVSDRSLVYNLRLKNSLDTILPNLVINSPLEETLSFSRGSVLTIDGILEDNRPLALGGNAHIELWYRNINSTNGFTAAEINFSEVNDSSVSFSMDWLIPISLVKGEYLLVMTGYDGVRNRSMAHRWKLIL
jgi:hypothetical protein